MLSKSELSVKKSTLPGAGKGLFTKVAIPKGTLITEYTGRVSTWNELSRLPDNAYLFYVTRNHVIDAKPYKTSLARFANDARGINRMKGITNNCEYVTVKKRVYIKAKRNIEPGEEILVGYGREYWDVIRENKRQSKRFDDGKEGHRHKKTAR
ncbi:MAG: SET domain-containing protein-lysine N-methyltransferase [Chitinophagaceae bacterium]|nr:SET domain-containing protein-lysine N-methyltransferase [Chitinophagaceae bacterium]